MNDTQSIKITVTTVNALKDLKSKMNLKSVNETLLYLVNSFNGYDAVKELAETKATLDAFRKSIKAKCKSINDELEGVEANEQESIHQIIMDAMKNTTVINNSMNK